MAHPLSALGAVHTILSLVPLVAGAVSFRRHGRIAPGTRSGTVYLAGLVVSVVTSFGLSSTGRFNAGHALGLLALLAVAVAWTARRWAYLAAFAGSFSFFLLLVPGINETLTRLPAGHPLASGPESPLVRGALLAWLALFVIGAVLQAWAIRAGRARAGSPSTA